MLQGSTCKDSYAKRFKTIDSTENHSPGAMNRGEVLRACFRNFQLCFHLNFYPWTKVIFHCTRRLAEPLLMEGGGGGGSYSPFTFPEGYKKRSRSERPGGRLVWMWLTFSTLIIF